MIAFAVRLLIRLFGLSNPIASVIVTAILGLAKEEVTIMQPVVMALIKQADADPTLKSGPAKFVYVFEKAAEQFPAANGRALGTLINILVQAVLPLAAAPAKTTGAQ